MDLYLSNYASSDDEALDEVAQENDGVARSLEYNNEDGTIYTADDVSISYVETKINSEHETDSPSFRGKTGTNTEIHSAVQSRSEQRFPLRTALSINTTEDELEAFFRDQFGVSAQGFTLSDLLEGYSKPKLWKRTKVMLHIDDSLNLPLLEIKLSVLAKTDVLKKRKATSVLGPGKKLMVTQNGRNRFRYCQSKNQRDIKRTGSQKLRPRREDRSQLL